MKNMAAWAVVWCAVATEFVAIILMVNLHMRDKKRLS